MKYLWLAVAVLLPPLAGVALVLVRYEQRQKRDHRSLAARQLQTVCSKPVIDVPPAAEITVDWKWLNRYSHKALYASPIN